ncbi:DUF4249 family protein [uncultured Maribacter sp.]|uniref:DUF4249 family protein n=1 Tax=uncultured Maribacter sp. TaxID=431308 RepID=UPI0026298B6E|nr:DUF4249 family protein [uncultured Maribacter sp.]
MKNNRSALLIILVFVYSCTKEVKPDNLYEQEEQVFIQGYLSPTDENISIYVSRALLNFGTKLSRNDYEENKDKFVIKNALVRIENTKGESISLPYSLENRQYQVSKEEFAITEGEKYYLEVDVEGKKFSSECIIPKKIGIVNTKFGKGISQYGGEGDFITVSFEDLKGSKDFYIIGGRIVFEGLKHEGVEQEEDLSSELYFGLERFATDVIGDGNIISSKGEMYTYYHNEEDNVREILRVQVAHVDENLYQNLRATYSNYYNNDNPFAEYVIAPDNIEGENGVGVFGGYNLTEKEIVLTDE